MLIGLKIAPTILLELWILETLLYSGIKFSYMPTFFCNFICHSQKYYYLCYLSQTYKRKYNEKIAFVKLSKSR